MGGDCDGTCVPGTTIRNIQQCELATFLSQPEFSIPQKLIDKFLSEPALMKKQREIIVELAERVQNGEPPLNHYEFYELVLSFESNRGTALLFCHNITKALSRGVSPIGWKNVSREPLIYSMNGINYEFDPSTFHKDANAYTRNQLSTFYAMFSEFDFGSNDDGNWYHFYATATVLYYKAKGLLQPDVLSQHDLMTQTGGDLVIRMIASLRDTTVMATPYYEGWLLANAISFLEGGVYGRGQNEVNDESKIHIQGASTALELFRRIPESNWQWHVPVSNGMLQEISNFRYAGLSDFKQKGPDKIFSSWQKPSGTFGVFVMSGNVEDHWYDTPDCYVEIPTSFLSFSHYKTSVKKDTTKPVWNEKIGEFDYSALSSLILHLKDDDYVSDDAIEVFNVDLRPTLGKDQEDFNLSSATGKTSLKIRVVPMDTIILK